MRVFERTVILREAESRAVKRRDGNCTSRWPGHVWTRARNERVSSETLVARARTGRNSWRQIFRSDFEGKPLLEIEISRIFERNIFNLHLKKLKFFKSWNTSEKNWSFLPYLFIYFYNIVKENRETRERIWLNLRKIIFIILLNLETRGRKFNF